MDSNLFYFIKQIQLCPYKSLALYKPDLSAEDASIAQMCNKMFKSPTPKSAEKKTVQNIVSSGDEDETGKSSSHDSAEKSYSSPEPYNRDFYENIRTLSIQLIPLLSPKTINQKKFRSLTSQ